MKKGVLLVNLGTPDEPTRGAVYTYLKQFLLDPRVIDIPWLPRNLLVRGIIAPFRSGSSSKIYKKLWTEDGSPIKIYGYTLQKEVQKILGEEYLVELAMRYQSPSIESALKKLKDAFVAKAAEEAKKEVAAMQVTCDKIQLLSDFLNLTKRGIIR